MTQKLKILSLLLTIVLLLGCRDYDITQAANTPPFIPIYPSPVDGEVGVSTSPTLSWICSDPDFGDSVVYDIYFNSKNPPDSLVVTNWSQNNFSVSNLDTNKTYFWKVIARDNHGGVSAGKLWQFTTHPSIPNFGLLAYYPFDGNANDASGNANHGIIKGTYEFVNGVRDQGVRLVSQTGSDSLGGHILLPNFHFKTMSDFSYSLWVKEEVLLGDEFYIFLKDDLWASEYAGIFRSKSLGNIEFQVSTKYPDMPLTVNFPSSFKNHFIHYCVVSESDTMKAFINGIMIGKKYQRATVDGVYTAIARHWMGNITYTRFTGVIDEVRFYNRALTEVEVKALYHGLSKGII